MKYYLMYANTTEQDVIDSDHYLLGESGKHTFYAGPAFHILDGLLNSDLTSDPKPVGGLYVMSESGNKLTLIQFLNVIMKLNLISE